MKQIENGNDELKIFGVIWYVLSILFIFSIGILENQTVENIFTNMILVVLLLTILMLIFTVNNHAYFRRIAAPKLFLAGYILACILMLLSYFTNTFNLWLIGVVFIALSTGYEEALLLHVMLAVMYGFCFSLDIVSFAYYLIMGSILCLICSRLKTWYSVLYAVIIGVCGDLCLQFVLHGFDVSKVFCRYSLFSAISTSGVVVMAYLIAVIMGSDEENQTNVEVQTEEAVQEEDSSKLSEEERIRQEKQEREEALDKILDQDYELLIRLQEYSKSVYMHSVDISTLSGMAAEAIGVDAKLARAGGLYHEIGRIKGDDYIAAGVELAKEAGFPKEVTDIIAQHNAGAAKPQSVEAAIVMLSDSIVSTLEYLESMGKQDSIPADKLVMNIFENRLKKGGLDECNLNVSDYQKLIQFYKSNAF